MQTQETEVNKRTFPEQSVDVRLVADRLRQAKPDEVIPYQVFNEIIRGDVQFKQAWVLMQARKVVLREDRMVFECVRGVGLKRLTDSGISGIGEQSIAHIHRHSARATKKMACADYATLGNEEKIRYNAHLSVLGALRAVTTKRKIEKLEIAAGEQNRQLALKDTLKLFANGGE